MSYRQQFVDQHIWQEALLHRRIFFHYFKILAQRHSVDYNENEHLTFTDQVVTLTICDDIQLTMTPQEFKRLHSLSFASLAVFYRLCEQYHQQLQQQTYQA